MRILFLIDSFAPGGAERSLHELIPCFEEAGIGCSVVALEDGRHGVAIERDATSYSPLILSGRNGPARVRELRALISTKRPDIVQTSLYRADITGRLAAWRTGTKVVTSLVNTSYEPSRLLDRNIRRSRFVAAREVDGWTARHLTDHFHAITHAVKDSAVRRLRVSPERVTVIERGRDAFRLGEPSDLRRTRMRTELGLGSNDAVIVNVGRQDPQKDQATLIEAFDLLAPRVPSAKLVIAGRRGNASNAIDDRVRSSPFRDRIMVLGHRSDVPDVLAASDVFAFPSIYEGLGGAVIEAMALALPVVASDLPALREVVVDGETGVLVPSRAPAELAFALEPLLRDAAAAQEMGARGRRRFEEVFSLERSASRMIRLFEQVLGTC